MAPRRSRRPAKAITVVAFVTFSVVLVIMAGPAVPQAPASPDAPVNLVIEDPVGDPGPAPGVGVAGNPAMTMYQHVDITRLEIGNEGGASFEVIFGMAGFDPLFTAPAQAVALADISCRMGWSYGEGSDYEYSLQLETGIDRMPGSPPDDLRASMNFNYAGESGSNFQVLDEGVTVVYEPQGPDLRATITKAFVPVFPGPVAPSRPHSLVIHYALCLADVAGTGEIGDVVDVSNRAYTFQHPGNGRNLMLRFAAAAFASSVVSPLNWTPPQSAAEADLSSVAPGTANLLPMIITNNGDSRREVQLRASFLGSEGIDDWALVLAPRVLLDPGGSRVVNLVVTPPPDAVPGVVRRLEVVAQGADDSDLGVASRALKILPAIDPLHNILYFHSRAPSDGDVLADARALVNPQTDIMLSQLTAVEGWEDSGVPISPVWGADDQRKLDPLSTRVRLDAEVPVEVALGFEGDPGGQVDVRFFLNSAEFGAIAYVEATMPTNGVTVVPALIDATGILSLPPGTVLDMTLKVIRGAGASVASDIRFDPKSSFVKLPVLQSESLLVLGDGRFLPNLALHDQQDALVFLNPADEYAFDLVLANDGVQTDDLTISTKAAGAEGWNINVMPGRTFRLPAGNSTPFAVVVVPPATVPEFTQLNINVTASSRHDEKVRATLEISVVVTSGVEIEPKPYRPGAGQMDALPDDALRAPAVGMPVALLAAAGALAVARRFAANRAGRRGS